jgi:hypothetical protein
MKLYDENKNYVADIPKPEPIEQDGKWWEFTGLEAPEKGKEYLNYNGNKIFKATYDWQKFDIRWIASEIPRATPEKLRAIGMKERDGRPVKITPENYSDIIWTGKYVSGYKEHIGKYRFVLVPDVQEEKHTSCEGCEYETGKHLSPCNSCCSRGERKNYTPRQPPRTDGYRLLKVGEVIQEGDEFLSDYSWDWLKSGEVGNTVLGAYKTPSRPLVCYRRKVQQKQPDEPRFTNEQIQQIDQWIDSIINDHPNNTEFIAHLHYLKGLLYNWSFGILAFTERRRG